MNLSKKRILITGAARGLGRELSLLLYAQGCLLTLVDREHPSLDLLQNAQAFICDLSILDERKRLIEQIPSVDILINCAGVGSHSSLEQLKVDEIERVLQVNTLAPLELIAGLASLELIVNIGSVAGEMNLPSIGLYAASKSALHAFTKSIALEGAHTLLVILGPLRGTDFSQSIAHPRSRQPIWYRSLDLDVKVAAHEIVRAMKKGKSKLIVPRWYLFIFQAAKLFEPFMRWFKSV